MADENDFADYPKARVAMDSGDLIDCTNVTISRSKSRKSVSTLRQNPAGSTSGAANETLEVEEAISHAGFERDWQGAYERDEVKEFRVKLPGKTFVIVGRLDEFKITSSVDDYIKFTFKVIGRYQVVPA